MPPSIITEFTPWGSLFGGVLIGLAAVMVMALFGRVAGISGITVGALPTIRSDWSWRLAFLVGLVAAPLLLTFITGGPVVQTVSDDLVVMILAGLLVGFGTIWGSGCTSGHGVCGLARLSMRSLVAVGTFMTTAFLTVLFLRHIIG
ncbi:YeeE/YedE family protein [Aurantimonas marina]|uniref:YeeE/YedE family protein n=1 Tax=Aurantimonas marina TaxID=2780508 RepID=UPI0019CFF9EF|nr:YeeE/YedE thiosulfate transporter family protein [Aurantimonas marina]